MSYSYPCTERRYSLDPGPTDRYYNSHQRYYPESSSSYWQHPTPRPQQYSPEVAATPQIIYHYDYTANNPSQQHSGWPADTAQSSYRTSSNVNTTPAVGFGDSYPESSQRTILTPSTNYSSSVNVHSPAHYKNDLPRSPSLSPDYSSTNSWGDALDDSSESSCQLSASLAPSGSTPLIPSTSVIPSSPHPSSTSVKEEPDDSVGRFIMELSAPQVQSTFLSQSLAPPTEVPLRATQAPPKMRSMMGVFRLNPFAMHSGEGRGVVAPTWCGEEAHPLDEEPVIFEFQLELEDSVSQIPKQPKEPLRSFSPDFELHQERNLERDQNDWQEYHSESAFSTSTPPTWELDYPPNEEHFSPPEPVHLQARQSSRLYESTSFKLFSLLTHFTYRRLTSLSALPSKECRTRGIHGRMLSKLNLIHGLGDQPRPSNATTRSVLVSRRLCPCFQKYSIRL